MAGTAATAAGVHQLERPHQRWALYRGYQRALEVERFRYLTKVGSYTGDEERERKFAENLSHLLLQLHEEWSGLLPTATELENNAGPNPTPP